MKSVGLEALERNLRITATEAEVIAMYQAEAHFCYCPPIPQPALPDDWEFVVEALTARISAVHGVSRFWANQLVLLAVIGGPEDDDWQRALEPPAP